MGKVVAIGLIIVGLIVAGVGGYAFYQTQKPNAGLKIETNPSAVVFMDNVQVGVTPFKKEGLKAGEVSIKLVPNSVTSTLSTYQTKVRLTNRTYTVINRVFGDSDMTSEGETINLESSSVKSTSMAVVVSGPDSASIMFDGQPLGFSPLLAPEITAGDHVIVVSAPGFSERRITAHAQENFQLKINVKLKGTPLPTPVIIETPKTNTSHVEIKSTPTGFLRVRQLPKTSAKEMGRVDPGDKFMLLESIDGWYRIEVELDSTKSGWISAQYATKYE
ncbi:MAG: PEGA domain protein [Candidatus Amesbacteria bacterium GW2011_GWA2_42_12]|uniref:PEGA domain protein n=1 Tax=Candidatus Amesbacteria bacterium GW2011_GWA2_42_12 TaxID=1618356 RepID=A0A0G0Y942_9BACT|nr:MAG: PEGA domain protein [Candidatus Amesbacteria bacterium GW2011_GWA2_42_12]